MLFQQDIIAKTATIISLVNGFLTLLFPKVTIKIYGPPSTALHEHIIHVVGVTNATLGLLFYFMIFQELSLAESVGWCQIIWLIEPIRNLSMGLSKKLGNPIILEIFPLCMASTIIYSCLIQSSYSDIAAEAFGYFSLVTGVSKLVDPELDSKAWGCTDKKNARELSTMRTIGYFFLSIGTFVASVARGYSKYQAVGLAWIPIFACTFAPFFVTNEVKDHNLNVRALLPWFVIHAIIIGSLVL